MIGKKRKILLALTLILSLLSNGAGIAIAGDQNSYGDQPTESPPNPFVLPCLSDGDIWLVDTDGLPPRRIIHSGRATEPTWPSGLYLLILVAPCRTIRSSGSSIWRSTPHHLGPTRPGSQHRIFRPVRHLGPAWPGSQHRLFTAVRRFTPVRSPNNASSPLVRDQSAPHPGPPTDSNSPGSQATNWSWPTSTGTRRPLPQSRPGASRAPKSSGAPTGAVVHRNGKRESAPPGFALT